MNKKRIVLCLLFLLSYTVNASEMSLPSKTVELGETFELEVYCVPSEPIKSFELELRYNPEYIEMLEVEEGDFFSGYPTFFNSGETENGSLKKVYDLIIGQGNITEEGTLVIITCKSLFPGDTEIHFFPDWTGVTNETMYLPLTTVNSTISIYVDDGSLANYTYVPTEEPAKEGTESDNSSEMYDTIFMLINRGLIFFMLIALGSLLASFIYFLKR